MVFKPVGVDENGKFPDRVEEALSATYAPLVEIVATPATYPGLDLTGTTSSTAALGNFLADVAAADAAGSRVHAKLPSGKYLASGLSLPVSNHIRLDLDGEFIQASNAPILRCYGSWGPTQAVTGNVVEQRTFNDLFRDMTKLTFSSAPGWVPGDLIKVFTDDVIAEARPGSAGLESRNGEFATVAEISGASVYLMGPLRETYTANVRAARIGTGKLEITGFTGSTPNSGMATWTAALLSLESLASPVVDGFTVHQGCATGLSLKSLVSHVVRGLDVRYLNNNGAGGQYGYAILDSSCEAGLIEGPSVRNVRHAFTDDTPRIAAGNTDPANYGRSRGSVINGGRAVGVSGSAWDTHHAGERHTFIGCVTSGSGSGANLRGRDHKAINCTTVTSRTGFQAIEEIAGGITYGIEFINCTTDMAVFEAVVATARNRNSKTMMRVIGGRHTAKGRALTSVNARVELDGNATFAARAGSATSNGELIHATNSEIAVSAAKVDWSATTSGVGQTFVRLADATSSLTGRNLDVVVGGATARVSSVVAGDVAAKGSVALNDVRIDTMPGALFVDVAAGSYVAKSSPITFAPAEISSLGGSPTGGTVGASGDNKFPVYLMDAAASEDIGVSLSVPSDWKLINVSVVWANTAASTGDVKWTLNRTQAGPGDDATVKTAYSAVDSAPATVGPLKYTTVASNLPVDPTKMQVVRIRREGADALDTLANDAGVAQIVVSRVA